jgi:polyhydroxybutyrate depolymerase
VAVVIRANRRPLALAIVAIAACLLPSAIAPGPTFPGIARAHAERSGDAGCLATFGPGDTWLRVPASGRNRDVILHVPPSLDASRPAPLLIAVHGWASSATAFAGVTGLSAGGDQRSVVVAYPQGLGTPAGWHFPGIPTTDRTIRQADLALFDALLANLTSSGCVDPSRVFVAGHSQGGGMAAELACRRADRLAGVTLISGEHFRLPCAPSRPIPIVSLHAIDDEVLPYGGGRVTTMPPDFPPVLPAEDVASAWAAIDGCAPDAHAEDVTDRITRFDWKGCNAPVTFYRLRTGGHAWADRAGGAPISASDLVWSSLATLSGL